MAARIRLSSLFIPAIFWAEVAVLCWGMSANVSAQIDLSQYSAERPLQVMAIGDSITDDCSYDGAWRQYLQPLLQTNGYHFTFIGRQSSTPTRNFTQTHHEGYCGSVIAPPGMMSSPVHGYPGNQVYLLKIMADSLTNQTPDVALVVMGANDIGRGRDPWRVATNDIPELLNLIWSNAPNAYVILTKTTTLSNAVAGYATNASNVPIYNAVLQQLVNERAAQGQNIALADMFSVVDYSTMFNTDHLHPNLVGLNAMAKEFLLRIQLATSQLGSTFTNLIHAGSVWKYSDVGQDLGTNWVQPDYDDAQWSTGPARLGYGDKVAATTISFGPDFVHKFTTTYFRCQFVVPNGVAFTNLNFRLARQDGVVVWLNGHELFRSNLPDGPINYTNRALKRINGDAAYIFNSTNVAVASLPVGTNVLGVELHLNSPVSPSVGFDLELVASGAKLVAPALTANWEGSQLLVSWPGTSDGPYALYSTTDLSQSNSWSPQAGIVQTNGNTYSIAILPEASSRFFRLQRQ